MTQPMTTERPAINITPEALARVRELLDTEGDDALALCIEVRPGGCSGFRYEMYFDIPAPDALVESFDAPSGPVSVSVDPSSAVLLAGATLKFSDGLSGKGFSIDNPNAQRTCGCGSSFS